MRTKNISNIDRWLGDQIFAKCEEIVWVTAFPYSQDLEYALEDTLSRIYFSVRNPIISDKSNISNIWDKWLAFPPL